MIHRIALTVLVAGLMASCGTNLKSPSSEAKSSEGGLGCDQVKSGIVINRGHGAIFQENRTLKVYQIGIAFRTPGDAQLKQCLHAGKTGFQATILGNFMSDQTVDVCSIDVRC